MSATPRVDEAVCNQHAAPYPGLGIRRVLVVVDPTAATHPCIDKATRIALHCGAEIELYVCDTGQDGPGVSAARQARLDQHRHALEQLARPLRAQGLTVETCSEWNAPLELGVGLHVIRTQPDLVVKDSHRHEPSRAPITFTDWILIRQVPAPLLLVRAEPWPEHLRITVSCDPCHPAVRTPRIDEAMLDLGCTLGDALRADLDVMHVLEAPPHLPGEPVAPQARLAHHAAARVVVENLVAERNSRGVRIPLHFEQGGIAESIIQFTLREKPHLLIMGAAPRPRWAYAAAGGTAAQILESIPCDMLVIKPPGFVSPLLVTDE
jgi:universal stress protein E